VVLWSSRMRVPTSPVPGLRSSRLRQARTCGLVLAALVITLLPGITVASSSNCSSIRDPDQRHLCRAMAERRDGECSSIRDSDNRHYCRATVTGRTAECSSIKNADRRAFCRAQTR